MARLNGTGLNHCGSSGEAREVLGTANAKTFKPNPKISQVIRASDMEAAS
jgi:hypothetical protein